MFLASRAKGKMEGIMYRFIQRGRIAVLHCLVSLGGPSLGWGHLARSCHLLDSAGNILRGGAQVQVGRL